MLLYCYVRTRIALGSVQVIESSILFGSHLQAVVSHAAEVAFIDSLSHKIVLDCDRFNLPAVAMLALTCLRYSDLSNLDIRTYLNGGIVYVHQGKTETPFKLPDLPAPTVRHSCNYDIPQVPFCSSYSSVRYAINQVLPRIVRLSLDGSQSVTHVFRHLRASYLYSFGNSLDYISSILGHRSNDSTKHYIHDALVSYFKSNQ